MLDTLKRVDETSLGQIKEEMGLRNTNEVFLLFALGSQFDHLIKQRLAKIGVYCLVADPKSVQVSDVVRLNPKGIILSGGPHSVHSEPPPFDAAIFDIGIPVLGICLGFQMWAKHIGVKVVSAGRGEYGVYPAVNCLASRLFSGCTLSMNVLQSHGDEVQRDDRLSITVSTNNTSTAAAEYKHLFGVQFHPEVIPETTYGERIFENFCFDICGAKDKFPAEDVAKSKITEIACHLEHDLDVPHFGGRRVLLALSGGSDSSVVAYLLKHAINGRKGEVHGVYIKGIDRPDDQEHVIKYFDQEDWLTLHMVDATKEFLKVLSGVTEMHDKRVAMRGVYKSVLAKLANDIGASFIAQGTLYTDISESGIGHDSGARRATIKLHHNVNLGFSIPELNPLIDCVKDQARNIGRSIGVPEDLLIRHPFPGPGLLVRIEGEVNEATLRIARAVDGIWIDELRANGFYHKVWQAGAVVTRSIVTCTRGDDSGTGLVIRLWAVNSVNGFTAQRARLPDDFLDHVEQRITNEVRGVGSVDIRLSGKPPATIECG